MYNHLPFFREKRSSHLQRDAINDAVTELDILPASAAEESSMLLAYRLHARGRDILM